MTTGLALVVRETEMVPTELVLAVVRVVAAVVVGNGGVVVGATDATVVSLVVGTRTGVVGTAETVVSVVPVSVTGVAGTGTVDTPVSVTGQTVVLIAMITVLICVLSPGQSVIVAAQDVMVCREVAKTVLVVIAG